jgi:bacterial/archaeal transporter family-2 protein
VLLTLSAGMAISLQAFSNGRLGRHLGSTEIAACANNIIALLGTASLVFATGAFRRARARARSGVRVPWAYALVGVIGAMGVIVLATAAPKLGIAVLTVALVCGQTTGALVLDRLGLSTSGQHAVTTARLLGVALAIVAVVIGSLGSHGEIRVGLLALVFAIGASFATSAMGLSHLSRATGEPLVAAVANFAVGATLLVIYGLIVTGGTPADGWSAPPPYWISGGLCAMFVAFTLGVATRPLGVLRLSLLLIAGQSVGALVLDVVAPAKDAPVTAGTVLSLVLVFAAVAISNQTQLGPRLALTARR